MRLRKLILLSRYVSYSPSTVADRQAKSRWAGSTLEQLIRRGNGLGSILVLFFYFNFSGLVYGAGIGPDQDPFPGQNAAFWLANGLPQSFPLLDANNKYQVFQTQMFLAIPKNGINHDVDSKGIGHSHWHFQDDYLAAFNTQNINFTGQANAFWDVVFQAGIIGDMNRFQDAVTQRNCFSYALNSYIARGTYDYWIDDGNAVPGTPG